MKEEMGDESKSEENRDLNQFMIAGFRQNVHDISGMLLVDQNN